MRAVPILLFLITQLWLTACTKYQFGTIASNLKENARNEHILENDSVIIKYTFHGQHCPVTISIQNKLDVPLYVDWKRSAVILKDQSYTYWNDKATIRGSVHATEIQYISAAASQRATFSGEIVRDESVSFIPPRSLKETSMITIQTELFSLPKKRGDHREERTIDGFPIYGLQYDFFKEESPLVYRSFLTLSTNPSFSDPLTYENEFWVSELFQTGARPQLYFRDKENINKFYTSKTTGFATFMVLAGAVAIAILLTP